MKVFSVRRNDGISSENTEWTFYIMTTTLGNKPLWKTCGMSSVQCKIPEGQKLFYIWLFPHSALPRSRCFMKAHWTRNCSSANVLGHLSLDGLAPLWRKKRPFFQQQEIEINHDLKLLVELEVRDMVQNSTAENGGIVGLDKASVYPGESSLSFRISYVMQAMWYKITCNKGCSKSQCIYAYLRETYTHT